VAAKITIVGAGLAGSLLSVYLAKKGFNVQIYEKRPDMRKHELDGGRSINLALSARGIFALEEVGLYDDIKKITIPMYGRYIHPLIGGMMLQPYGKDNTEFINSVSRAELNKKLMDLAEQYNVRIFYNKKCTNIDFTSGELIFFDEDKGDYEKVKSETVIATDGAVSAVRLEMLKQPRFNYNQVYENYGYKELTIPPLNGKFSLYENALHIWPRGSYMLIALPNLDKSFTCTLFIAYERSYGEEASFENLNEPLKLIPWFSRQFPDAYEMMTELEIEFFQKPTGSLITVKCFPWHVGGKVLLLGDSAHAIVPFFGQGMNAAFEDCSVLNECINRYGEDWDVVFENFQLLRKDNTDAIADLAQENFIEMRDLVDDPDFQLRKKVEAELANRYPDIFVPKYSMVTFNRFPYSEALKKGRLQEKILRELTENINGIDKIDWNKANVLINEVLKH
jgi:kynurenine 3-monooxygenase